VTQCEQQEQQQGQGQGTGWSGTGSKQAKVVLQGKMKTTDDEMKRRIYDVIDKVAEKVGWSDFIT
jgi:hypothetical protein